MILSSIWTDLIPFYFLVGLFIAWKALNQLWQKYEPTLGKKIVEWLVMSDPSDEFYGRGVIPQTSRSSLASNQLVVSPKVSLKPYIVYTDTETGTVFKVKPGRLTRQRAFDEGWDSKENESPMQLPEFVLADSQKKISTATKVACDQLNLYGVKKNFSKKEVYPYVGGNHRG